MFTESHGNFHGKNPKGPDLFLEYFYIAMSENLERLIKALEHIWKNIGSNTAVIQKQKQPINGNWAFFFQTMTWAPLRK